MVACLGLACGVIVVQWLNPSLFLAPVWLVVGLSLVAVAAWKRPAWLLVIVAVGGGFIGLWRGSQEYVDFYGLRLAVGSVVTVQGVVAEDPDVGDSGELQLRLRVSTVNANAAQGLVWVSVSTPGDVRRSDVVTVHGAVAEGFGNFSAALFRPELVAVMRPVPGDVALDVRQGFAEGVRRGIDEPAASLGLGYVVGQRRGLPPELEQALQIAGLTHIVVASGYNLTILVRFSRRIFEKVSKFLAFSVSGGLILGFIAVTGMSPSMSRAGLVAGLSLVAWYYGRRFQPVVLLALVAAVTLLVNPSYGWGDIGWQLSFAAFAGVMILAPLLQAYFFGDAKPGVVRQIAGETIAAQLATLPIIIGVFGVVSTVALVANLLVLPFVPLAMLLTAVTGLVGVAVPALAQVVGAPAQWLLDYMVWVASTLADIPWASLELSVAPWWPVALYGLMAAATIYLRIATKQRLSHTSIIE